MRKWTVVTTMKNSAFLSSRRFFTKAGAQDYANYLEMRAVAYGHHGEQTYETYRITK
jgi:hypothetical protein